jgi:hypothetical protein
VKPETLLALQNRFSEAVDHGTPGEHEITITLSTADVAGVSYALGLATAALMPPRPRLEPATPARKTRRKR